MNKLLVLLLVTACGNKDAAPPPPVAAPVVAPVAATAKPAAAPASAAAAASPADKTAAFWTWFVAHAGELRGEKDIQKTMESISAEIDKVAPGVFGEIGGDGDKRTLVISCDGKRDLFPQVQAIYAARPTALPDGWTVVAFRQRDKDGGMSIELGGKKVSPQTAKFESHDDGGKLDVHVFIPGYTTDDETGQIGFVLMDHTVGEYDMETKIGDIEFAPIEKAPKSARPLTELPAIVDQVK